MKTTSERHTHRLNRQSDKPERQTEKIRDREGGGGEGGGKTWRRDRRRSTAVYVLKQVRKGKNLPLRVFETGFANTRNIGFM